MPSFPAEGSQLACPKPDVPGRFEAWGTSSLPSRAPSERTVGLTEHHRSSGNIYTEPHFSLEQPWGVGEQDLSFLGSERKKLELRDATWLKPCINKFWRLGSDPDLLAWNLVLFPLNLKSHFGLKLHSSPCQPMVLIQFIFMFPPLGRRVATVKEDGGMVWACKVLYLLAEETRAPCRRGKRQSPQHHPVS